MRAHTHIHTHTNAHTHTHTRTVSFCLGTIQTWTCIAHTTLHGNRLVPPDLEEEHALLSERLIYRDNLTLLKDIARVAALGREGGGLGAAIQKQVCGFTCKRVYSTLDAAKFGLTAHACVLCPQVAAMVAKLQAERGAVDDQVRRSGDQVSSFLHSWACFLGPASLVCVLALLP